MNLETAQHTWEKCLSDLKMQVTDATFNTWLRGSRLLAIQDDGLVIYVRHAHAVDWLTLQMRPILDRTVRRHFDPDLVDPDLVGNLDLQFTTDPHWGRQADPDSSAESPTPGTTEPQLGHAPIIAPAIIAPAILAFDPNTAGSGGFAMIGNYANTYWAALLGMVPWRIYTLVIADDKRRTKTTWTRPRSYTISALARTIPTSRNAIRGRWRRLDDQDRTWRPGAFDALTTTGVGQIHWHDNSPRWRAWHPGGFHRGDSTGQRIIYRIAVLTTLPLLTPNQVAQLPADLRTGHERYLATRDVDLLRWEQITIPTLAGYDGEALAGYNGENLTGAPAPVSGAPAPDTAPFFPTTSETQEER